MATDRRIGSMVSGPSPGSNGTEPLSFRTSATSLFSAAMSPMRPQEPPCPRQCRFATELRLKVFGRRCGEPALQCHVAMIDGQRIDRFPALLNGNVATHIQLFRKQDGSVPANFGLGVFSGGNSEGLAERNNQIRSVDLLDATPRPGDVLSDIPGPFGTFFHQHPDEQARHQQHHGQHSDDHELDCRRPKKRRSAHRLFTG